MEKTNERRARVTAGYIVALGPTKHDDYTEIISPAYVDNCYRDFLSLVRTELIFGWFQLLGVTVIVHDNGSLLWNECITLLFFLHCFVIASFRVLALVHGLRMECDVLTYSGVHMCLVFRLRSLELARGGFSCKYGWCASAFACSVRGIDLNIFLLLPL